MNDIVNKITVEHLFPCDIECIILIIGTCMVKIKNNAFIQGQSYGLSYDANESGTIYLSNGVNAKMDTDEYGDRNMDEQSG